MVTRTLSLLALLALAAPGCMELDLHNTGEQEPPASRALVVSAPPSPSTLRLQSVSVGGGPAPASGSSASFQLKLKPRTSE